LQHPHVRREEVVGQRTEYGIDEGDFGGHGLEAVVRRGPTRVSHGSANI
jgi:hypothetical protein